jgi:serine acetyltransferase
MDTSVVNPVLRPIVIADSKSEAKSAPTTRDDGKSGEPISTRTDARPAVMGDWEEPEERSFRGIVNRLLQLVAKVLPGGKTLRIRLHRARGVKIGNGVWIGYDVVLDTARPDLITIEDGVSISMGAMIIAHFKEYRGVRIEQEAFIGPGAIILPNVVIGRGAVVTAGSVVSHSIPAMTVVQGNPAVPVARCGIPFRFDISMKTFSRNLKPLRRSEPDSSKKVGSDSLQSHEEN